MKYFEKRYILLFILVFFSHQGMAEGESRSFSDGKVILTSQNITINVDVAKTEKQRMLGLMFRKELAEDRGMLFVFEKNEIQGVWMKNTLIPLDVIFISEQGEVVSMSKELLPCRKEPCNTYFSTEKAKYMLEINKGMIEKNKIKVGQQLLLTF